jgi:hypothetical protein
MSKRIDDTTRDLIEQIDRQLRDAERLRSYIAAAHSQVWPDRRQHSRIPAIHYCQNGGVNDGDASAQGDV